MAQEISTYLAQYLLDCYFGGQSSFSKPATIYIRLFTTSPGIGNSGGVEVSTSGTGYSPLAITNDTSHFSAASGRQKQNSTNLSWFTATGSFGPVVSVCAFDASSGGNLLTVNDIASGSQQSCVAGNVISFNSGDLSITIN